ncbi:DUF177 domain-containing protein [Alphaproteobacteria bacterium]|nr:DUF177 domain-containing protein [Alphaproteobacteria bacterium]
MPQFSVTSEINVETIRPDSDNFFKLLTHADDLQALAERFGWVAINKLAVELTVRKVARNCWDVSGRINAEIIQSCIVTVAPVAESIDFQIDERYVRSVDKIDEVEVRLDAAEPLKNGAIDIGELAVQSLGLAATAWPRVENAPESYSVGDQRSDHPFAGLSALKRKNQK